MFIYFNRQDLINTIDQLSIWQSIVGYVKLGDMLLNPLRQDNHLGSCFLKEHNGRIVLSDWASKKHSGIDCIGAYMMLNPTKKWDQVCEDLLLLSRKLPTSSYISIPGIEKPKEKVISQFFPIYRNWEIRDKNYWKSRSVNLAQLERPDTLVRPISGYTQLKGGKSFEMHFNELAYCYHHNNKVKFYFPDRKSFRFLGDATCNDIWHLERDKTLIISKSHKDMLVWENVTEHSLTHVQGEEFVHPDDLTIFNWELKYDRFIIVFDNDNAGREGAERLSKKFLYKTPEIYTIIHPDIKDIDDLVVAKGLKKTKSFIQKNFNLD